MANSFYDHILVGDDFFLALATAEMGMKYVKSKYSTIFHRQSRPFDRFLEKKNLILQTICRNIEFFQWTPLVFEKSPIS